MGALIDAAFDAASGKSLVLIGEGKGILAGLNINAPEFFQQIARLRDILWLLDAQNEAAGQFQDIEQRYAQELKSNAENGTPLPAPNGAPSALNRQQWILARTPNFKRWFGEWEAGENQSSKIIDDNHEPLMVYHGTTADFPEFRDTVKANGGGLGSGLGHFFTPSSEHASGHYAAIAGGNVIPVFWQLKIPLSSLIIMGWRQCEMLL